MKNISKQTKLSIEKAIAKVEEKSSCELIAVITQKSANYSSISLFITSILTLILPAFILLYKPFMDTLLVYQIQIVFFVIVF